MVNTTKTINIYIFNLFMYYTYPVSQSVRHLFSQAGSRLSTVYLLLSTVYCLPSAVYCLQSNVYCLLLRFTVHYLLSYVYRLLSVVYCFLFITYFLQAFELLSHSNLIGWCSLKAFFFKHILSGLFRGMIIE